MLHFLALPMAIGALILVICMGFASGGMIVGLFFIVMAFIAPLALPLLAEYADKQREAQERNNQ